MAEPLTLTIGRTPDGRQVAVISKGGHPQIADSGQCVVCTLEVVDGWSRRKIKDWFQQQKRDRPWETRQ